VHIALDVMGGDHGPVELVSGALQAVEELHLDVTLLGDADLIEKQLQAAEGSNSRIRIVHTTQMISMHETPFEAVRKKKDASIVVAFELLKNKKVDAVVSAGNSGATMAAAIRMLGRLKNISRPGIASVFPTLKKPLVMMDVGANVDCRPKHLFQFGVMGSAFSRVLCTTERPRIGLLSIGEEGSKGNLLVKSAHDLFQNSTLNFIGNVEGRDIFHGDVDVIVCDGFVGNVCLKVSEGLGEAILTMLKSEMSKSLAARLGYSLAKRAFTNFRKRVDYAEYGGAPLLGLNGIGIVCHGRSNALAIKNAIKVAAEMVRNKVNDNIIRMLEPTEHRVFRDNSTLPEESGIDLPGVAS
jgi:glycerol-3-phosphate acyltransferase PlsX